jgi:hypothetical protein
MCCVWWSHLQAINYMIEPRQGGNFKNQTLCPGRVPPSHTPACRVYSTRMHCAMRYNLTQQVELDIEGT